MEEETAIDVIYEMRDLIKQQGAQIALLQQSLSMINSKVNEKLFPEFTAPKAIPVPTGIPTMEVAKPTPKPKPPTVSTVEPRSNSRVHGKIQGEKGKNVPGVDVIVMDANNRVIKRTRSNRAGTWMSMLPPGRYSVEFSKEGMQPDFRTFEVRAGQKEIEVT